MIPLMTTTTWTDEMVEAGRKAAAEERTARRAMLEAASKDVPTVREHKGGGFSIPLPSELA